MAKRKKNRSETTVADALAPHMNSTHFSTDIKAECMALYVYGMTLGNIHKKLKKDGVEAPSVSSLQDWCEKYGWDAVRAEVWKNSYQKMIRPFANAGEYAYQAGLSILANQLQKKLARNEELEWDELKKLSDIIKSIQHVARLDEGKATEITESKTLREQKMEIRAILGRDPFEEFQDAIDSTKPTIEIENVSDDS